MSSSCCSFKVEFCSGIELAPRHSASGDTDDTYPPNPLDPPHRSVAVVG